MASTLRLILERYIAVQPKANKLSLPLDRNLGDITRYKYVFAGALPLRLERLSSEQPSANALSLGMMQPLGTIAPPLYFISSSLPLLLTVATSEQPLSSALPLNMSRKLGTSIAVPITPPDNNDVNIGVIATAVLTPTANASVSVAELDNSVNITVTATASLTPVANASLSAELAEVNTNIAITAIATLNPVASATASYDSNNPRLAMLDVSSDMQNAKLQGIDKRSSFENNDNLTQKVTADWQQSKLIGTDNQAQFEANEQLSSSSQVSFEQSKLIGDSSKQGAEYQTFIASKSQLKYEQSKLVGHDRWFSFEAMAKRQIERAIKGENAKLLADKLSSYNEYSRLLNTRTDFLIEAARLPFSKLRYVPPPLSQTVILKEQIIEGWECGSGALRHYVYNDELALPMTRRIADRGASSGLAIPMTMPRGVLILSAADADAMETYPCKRKTLAVNPTLDVTMCQPKVFGKSSGIAVNSQATLNAIAWLSLLIGEQGEAYNKGVIFVTNSVSLVRSDDGREIKMLGFSVGIDSNSYAWSFSASVPLSELSKVNTALESQINVELNVNGHKWRFILDSCDDTIAFGERSLSIKGKSRAALLAHPYSKHRGMVFDTPMTARQIAEDELNRGGIASGFTLDWQLVGVNGWDIPAKTYSYSGRTAINSLQWIAEAAGGFINSDMAADVIKMLPLYPLPSWQWGAATPDLILPQSLMLQRSQSRKSKPKYNGVQVWGERQGSVGALIKRTGTSGGFTPPMVTSDLITTNEVARARGIAILSDTGEMADVDITMPLHADFGVLKPSTLIGVNDGESWVGMVRGTSISGKIDDSQRLEIAQTVSIERHFEGA